MRLLKEQWGSAAAVPERSLSEMQYVGTQISYNQKKAAKEAAELDLWSAMNAYDWGIEAWQPWNSCYAIWPVPCDGSTGSR